MRLLLALSTALLSAHRERRTAVVDTGEDRPRYSVRKVERMKAVGALVARGTFYVVTLEIEGRATSHQWESDTAYLVGDEGEIYEHDVRAHAALEMAPNSDHDSSADRQETRRERLVFEVPSNLRRPVLAIRRPPVLDDLLDGLPFRRVRISLF